MWTNLTNGTNVASYHQSSPGVASTSYYPTAWYPEFTPTLCLPTPCAPCYTSIDTRLRSFPYPIVEEPLTVSVIPYVTIVANGSRITSYSTSTLHSSPGWNATDLTIELFEMFTWMEKNFTMTFPTTYIDLWGFAANIRPATPSYELSQSALSACANLDTLSHIPLSSPALTIWPLYTSDPTNSSSTADTLPSDMLVYLDGQPIVQSIFQGIPISSCSRVRQIQTAPCYDVFTFTTSRCTTVGGTLATSAINLTQCVTTADTVTRPRFWNGGGSRGGIGGVGRVSAQLLTYITGEPIYAPTPDGQTPVTSLDLPVSAARIGATPASTWYDGNDLPVETQAVSMTDEGTPVTATTEDVDMAARVSVLRQILLESGLQVLQEGSRETTTEHHLGSPTLPTILPQVEHIDVLKITLAVGSVASGQQLSHPTPQEVASLTSNTDYSDFEPANAEHTKADDAKDMPSPTGTQDTYSGAILSSNVVSALLMPSQQSSHDTSMGPRPTIAADSVPSTSQPSTITPLHLSPVTQTQALAPGSILSFDGTHLSVLPDASGLTFGDGSTLLLQNGETAETILPDGAALRISRSGTVYLVETSTADVTPQLSGPSNRGTTTEQITGEDVSLSPSIAEAPVGVATNGLTKGVTAGTSVGAASGRLRDVRDLIAGVLVALAWLIDWQLMLGS